MKHSISSYQDPGINVHLRELDISVFVENCTTKIYIDIYMSVCVCVYCSRRA